MQLPSLSHRRVKTSLALGLAPATCLLLGLSSVSANDSDKPTTPAYPASPYAEDSSSQRGGSPSYWSGSYWDAQDGKSFWHRLKPSSRRSQKAKTEGEQEKPAVNGSLRIRNENRARRR